jgi:hypothetical protein
LNFRFGPKADPQSVQATARLEPPTAISRLSH